ncbi:MAG: cobalamin-binding protein [Candidatus Obscuribacterales bacterium]|nr:cobalamin-binding protein [Candidatus Obscuribacterales bacterium]
MRIVSLIASSTEILHALGLQSLMVGRSHECDYPESVKALPVCTGPKFSVEGTSAEIDERVRRIVSESLSVYRVDADILNDLQPTHIITQSQCEVCAVSLKDVEQAVCHVVTSSPQVISLQPDSLEDVFNDIRIVGEALNASDKATRLMNDLRVRIATIAARCANLERKTVAFIEWIEPLMAGGNWMPTLIESAGGRNLFGVADKHSPYMSKEQLAQSNPDMIIVSPCGFDIPRTLQETHILVNLPFWNDLKCVQANNVIVADGNQYFNRPGPRLVESLEILAETIHPEAFHFGHEGTGWVRLKV